MAVQPFPNPRFRAFDANGDPLAGGLLYTYAAGTSTPLATYTTRAGDVANVNPVVLDANGEANIWTTPGVDYKYELRDADGVVQWTVDNIPSPAEASTTDDVVFDPGGRLTLTTGTPVTTSDVTAATTVYYAPYKHNKVPLYDGSAWALHSIATELSQATSDTTKSPAAVANNSNYDLFVWSDSGTLRLSRGPAWSSDTSRGTGAGTTELERVNGRYLNKVSITNGPAANRGLYVGTIRSDASAQINDSLLRRHVWNTYNRMRRPLRFAASSQWDYTTATIRQAGGSTSSQVSVVVGLSEDEVSLSLKAFAYNSTAGAGLYLAVGIGVDSVTAFNAQCIGGLMETTANNEHVHLGCSLNTLLAAGYHYLAWLEVSQAGGTTTWRGQSTLSGAITSTAGLTGSTLA